MITTDGNPSCATASAIDGHIELSITSCQLCADVARLRLSPSAAGALRHGPGQYLDVLFADGQRRSFSIANAPCEHGTIELHVRLGADGGATRKRVMEMQVGDRVKVTGPFGTLHDALADALASPPETTIVLIAGGTGYPALRAVAAEVLQALPARPVYFYWGARSRGKHYDEVTMRQWQQQFPGFTYVPVVSDDDSGEDARPSVPHAAAMQDHADLSNHHVFLCGPMQMTEAASAALLAAGLPAARLHQDAPQTSRCVP